MKLAELFVEITGRDGGLRNTLSSVRNELMGAAATAGRVGASIGLAVGGVAALGLYKAVQGASDLSETLSKVDQVFGGSAGTVKATADEMATAFGLPKREILDAASAIGLVGKGAGYTQAQAAGLGSQMAKLAADASSFYNVPLDQALDKIRAGLVGESEPLRAFGVMLSEDAVKAEALRMGLAKNAKELTDSAKIQARASLISKGLGDATGDLERTQGGAANQTRKFWGQMQNLSDTIGTALLPAFNEFLGLANDIGSDLAKAFGGSGVFAGLGKRVQDAMKDAKFYYRNFGDVVALVGVEIAEAFEKIVGRVKHAGEAFKTLFQYIIDNRGGIAEALKIALVNPLDLYLGRIKDTLLILRRLMTGNVKDFGSIAGDIKDALAKALDPSKDLKLGELKIPEFKFDAAGFNKARQEILDRIAKNEANPNPRPNPRPNPNAPPGATPAATPAAEQKRSLFQGGLEEFQRHLQAGIFKDDSAKKIADNTAKMVALQQQQLNVAKGKAAPQPGFAVGAG